MNAPTAEQAFLARKAQIDAALARLAAHSAEHFAVDPDALTWADVGTLDHVAASLQQLCDGLFGEGEYAPAPATPTRTFELHDRHGRLVRVTVPE